VTQIFQPDRAYFDALAQKIVRLSGVSVGEVSSVSINCGNDGSLGAVILKSGQIVKV
jgi:hypothetical protein